MSDISRIADTSFEDIPHDKPLVDGDYVLKIISRKFVEKDGENWVRWTMKAVRVIQSALTDEDLMDSFPVFKDHCLEKTNKKEIKVTRNFFEYYLGLPLVDDNGAGIKAPELCERALGAEVRALIKVRTNAEGKPFVNIVRFLKVEEAN